jgi:hydroxymethylglutaryl-CoA synthase
MAGIISAGAHVPVLRINRRVIADAWERRALGGERSVSNHDEDSITMAVEAATNCLGGIVRHGLDGLFFATTTAPYIEKMNSSVVATALDMRRDIVTCDFAHSLRGGTGALRAALNRVQSGSANKMIVASADNRLGYPKSDQEQAFGDAAAAVVVGDVDLIAGFVGDYSINNEMIDVWRTDEDKFVNNWEGRFVLGEGFTAQMREVVTGILKKYNFQPKDIAKVILPAPDMRTHQSLAKKLGFNVETQVQDCLMETVGFCGTAQPLLMLAAAFEESKPGDLLLVAAYGDGADAMLFKATERITAKYCRNSFDSLLKRKLPLNSYPRFLSYRNILKAESGEAFRLLPSATVTWRESNSLIRCHGSRCKKCGELAFPIQRICNACLAKDEYEEVRISGMEGKVFTFTKDNLAGRSDDPVVVQTVCELEDGLRFYGLMTDCDPSKVELNLPVALTFRRFHEGGGFHNYFWKCRPASSR